MRKLIQKTIVLFVAMLFFVGLLVPNFGGADRLDWTPDVMVEYITILGTPAVSGQYANQSHQIEVTVMNTGEMKLTGINVSCLITSGATTYFDDYDLSIGTLGIGESDMATFTWDNMVEGLVYDVNASVSADGFGTMVYDYDVMQIAIANVTSWEISSISLWNDTIEEIPAYDGQYRLDMKNAWFINHTLQVFVVNTGNQILSGPTIEASFYEAADPTGIDASWTDTTSISGNINAGFEDFAVFNTYFSGTSEGMKTLNISVNNQNQSFMFELKNVTNFEVSSIISHEDGGSYANITYSVTAMIMNTGNIENVFSYISGFDVTLTIYDDVMSQVYQDVYALQGGDLVSLGDPAGVVLVTFENINETIPAFEDGMYYFNVSINPNEPWYGVSEDNYLEISVNLADTTTYEVEIDSPYEGLYDVADISSENIVATFRNTGTLDLMDDYYLQVDIQSLDSNELWMDLLNITVTDDIYAQSEKQTNIGGWPALVNFNGNFTVNVKAMRESDDSYLANAMIMVTLVMGEDMGTISGTVSGITHAEQVEVSVWDESATTQIASLKTTGTGASRPYQVNVMALPGGYNYTIAALASDNYWYNDVLVSPITAFSGRATIGVDLALTAKATGRVNGSVMLMAGMDAPPLPVDIDWSDVELMVEGMPSKFITNETGHFDQEVVVGTLNVSAMKENFMSEYNNSVVVQAGNNTTVEFILYEMWNVMVTPVHGTMDVPIDTMIVAKFMDEINTTTVTPDNFTVMGYTGTLNETHYKYSDGNKTVTLDLPTDLEHGKKYYVHIGEEVLTTAGEKAVHRMWHSEFTTELGAGHVEGWVKNEAGAPLQGVQVSIGAINDVTNETGYFLLENVEAGAHKVKAELATYEMKEVDVTVKPGMTVNVTITLVKIQPRIEAFTPSEGKTDVAIDANIVVTFMVPMNVSTITNATFLLDSGTRAPVAGTITASNSNKTFTFDPDANLTKGVTYTWTLKKSIQAAGEDVDWFYEDLSHSFTTVMPIYEVTATITPADNSQNVALDAQVKITFDYAMNRTTTEPAITAAFKTGFSWAADNKSVTINHDAFSKGTQYTVSISNAATSVEGYKVKAVSSTFTTITDGDKETIILKIKGKGKVTLKGADGNDIVSGTVTDNQVSLEVAKSLPAGTYTVQFKGSDDYKDKTWKITKNTDGSWTGDGIDNTVSISKEAEPTGIDPMAILAIIIVVIIIIILLALAMKPKKPAEEEIVEEEEEEAAEGEEEFECPECGAVVTSGETVCPECGAEFEEEEFECPECGASVEGGVTTCPECGAEFEEEEDVEAEVEEEDEEFEVEDEEAPEAGEAEEGEGEELEEEGLEEEDEDLEEELEEEDEELEEEDEELEEEDEELEEEEDEELEEEDEDK